MTLRRAKIGLLLIGCLTLAPFVPAQGAKKADAAPEDKQVVDSKATQRPAAASVNFRKELNVPLDSLSTLGARIEAATRKPDPVALAHMANELAVSQEQIEADKRAMESKEEPTGGPRKVVVNNYATQYLDVYVNGYMKTTVQPGSTQVITVEHRWNPTVLKAYGNEDTNVWGPRDIWGQFDKYTWNIN